MARSGSRPWPAVLGTRIRSINRCWRTSPVYVDVSGRRVARVAAGQWSLQFLDTLEQLVSQHGHFHPATRAAHFGDFVAVLDEARAFYRRVVESADR
jgi:hypothetical protein